MLKRTSHPCLKPISLPTLLGVSGRLLPCGKCPNCLKRKASELVVRVDRQLQGRSVAFLTFTYDNEHCPIYCVEHLFHRDTGEVIRTDCRFVDFSDFFVRAPFVWRTNKKGFRVMRFLPYVEEYSLEAFFDSEFAVSREYYMSIRYDDIQGCFKRVRIDYDFGDYLLVPEYGSAGYRPHYHMLCIGFSDDVIEALVEDWQSRFGAVDVRKVSCTDLDACRKLSAYITKYCSKGRFDCPYIFFGNCLRPRRSQSLNFGCGSKSDLNNLAKILKRTDLYGDYDVNEIPDGFNPLALSSVRVYDLNGFAYPMPKYLIKKIFFNKGKEVDSEGKTRYFCRASAVQMSVSARILADLVADYKAKLPDDEFFGSSSCVSAPVTIFDDGEASYTAAVSHFIGELERTSIY